MCSNRAEQAHVRTFVTRLFNNMCACVLQVVTYLHKLETDVHPKPHKKWGGSWLMWAAASGEADITDELANGNEPGGTSMETKDEHGFTAAFWVRIFNDC